MSAPQYDSARLLTAVRRDSFIAKSDDNWSDTAILSIADDITMNAIAPALKTMKQSWFAASITVPLVANQMEYDYPEEAMWSSVDAIHVVDSKGNVTYKLTQGDMANRGMYQTNVSGTPQTFWAEQGQFGLSPYPGTVEATNYVMCVSYYRRPAQLVHTTDCVQITATNAASLTVSVPSLTAYMLANGPDAFTSGSPYRFDVFSRTAPYVRRVANMTATGATTITFTGSITAPAFARIQPGDWLSVHGTSCFPDMPADVQPFLYKGIQQTIQTAQTDPQGLQALAGVLQEGAMNFIKGMSNRADGTPRKLSLYNAGTANAINRTRRMWWSSNGP